MIPTASRAGRAPAGLLVCALAALALSGCGVDETGIDPPADSLWFPLGVAAHPDGRYLYVNNSVFDRRFNAGTVMVYDTEQGQILADATARMGLFAGELVMGRRRPADCTGDDCVGPLAAFTVSRNDDQLIRIEVDASAANSPAHLRCDRDGLACAGDSIFSTFGSEDELAADPYSIALDGDGLWLTHVDRGVLSRWDQRIMDDGSNGTFDYLCSINLSGGATTVAVHPTSKYVYVSDRLGQRISVVQRRPLFGEEDTGVAGSPCELQVIDTIIVDPAADRGRTRGLAFSADGSLLYAASSTDQTLRIYDTTIGTGRPRNRLLGIVPLGGFPNLVRVAGVRTDEIRVADGLDLGPVGRALDAPEAGEGLVYVTLFDADEVVVIDPDLMLIVARIDVGDGPHDIAFMPDAEGNLRGYVSLFNAHRIAVVDLQPGSADRFNLVETVP